jgi:cell division protein FtsW
MTTATPASPATGQPGPEPGLTTPVRTPKRSGGVFRSLAARLDSPLASYYLVLGSTVALIGIGLVMVLSSSSVTGISDGGSAFTVFWRQATFAALGVPLMVLAIRTRGRTWSVAGWPLLAFALFLQLLVFVPGLGKVVNGNRNWIAFGPVTMQPSEVGKLALVVWCAAVLARKKDLVHQPMHALIPVVPGAGLLLILVLGGRDLGTALILMGLLAAVLYIAGAPLRIFGVGFVLAALLVKILVDSSGNRVGRIGSWLSGCNNPSEQLSTCYQTLHGEYALATGNWWGVGLGASRQKWGLLPEAHNDFIFAIIGEELGLVGTLLVVGLFATLGFGLFRVMMRTPEMFVKIATGGVLVWVLGQAVVNIGAVIGLLPVVGLPLPLVSSGGSALVMTMVALGMVIGFARREEGAAEALAARAGLVQRSLAVLPVRRDGRSR